MFQFFRNRARIDAERRDRALNIEQKRASQALLNGRVERLLESQRRAKTALQSDAVTDPRLGQKSA